MADPILRAALDAILGADRAAQLVGPNDTYLTAAMEQAAITAFRTNRANDVHTDVLRRAFKLAAAGELSDNAFEHENFGMQPCSRPIVR